MSKTEGVTLFIPCIMDAIYPEVGEAVVTVLKRLGLSIDYPVDQTCCGQPAFNSGYKDAARTAARRFIEIFETAGTIVCPSGSCVAMVRHHYADLFRNEPRWLSRAGAIGRRTFEFTEYLIDVLGVEDLGARYHGKVTYHESCHLLRGLNVSRQPRRLLGKVTGLELVEMENADYCCGFGGAFSVKYPEISTAVLDDKVRHILDSGAGTVTGGDMGCLMNIQGRLSRMGLPVKTLHIAQILASNQP